MCSRETFENSEFYNDWVLPQEDIIAGGGSILFKEDSRMFIIGGNIRRKDKHLEKHWLEIVSLITPHLQNAIEINRVIARGKLEQAAQAEGMNTSSTAIFIVNNFGKILFLNSVAQQLVSIGEVAKTGIGSKLEFSNGQASSAFKRIIHSLNLMNRDVSSSFEVFNHRENSQYVCRTARFDPRDHDTSPYGILICTDHPCVLLTISKIKKQQVSKSQLSARFGITETEAEVVMQLVGGLSPREISDQREVSIYTIRNQIKSAMSKMNVHRQIDLANVIG